MKIKNIVSIISAKITHQNNESLFSQNYRHIYRSHDSVHDNPLVAVHCSMDPGATNMTQYLPNSCTIPLDRAYSLSDIAFFIILHPDINIDNEKLAEIDISDMHSLKIIKMQPDSSDTK